MVKLSLYKASNAPIILIVRIVKNKLCLFIKWNMIYNTFEEGQFLKNNNYLIVQFLVTEHWFTTCIMSMVLIIILTPF